MAHRDQLEPRLRLLHRETPASPKDTQKDTREDTREDTQNDTMRWQVVAERYVKAALVDILKATFSVSTDSGDLRIRRLVEESG